MHSVVQLYQSLSLQRWDKHVICGLLFFEAVVVVFILRYVPYTEIDWKAYMEEVSMWQEGELDYMKIKGGTGPLVYPAGFLYLFGLMKKMTRDGHNIHRAQYIFGLLYMINMAIILSIYTLLERNTHVTTRKNIKMAQAHRIWSWRVAMALLCLSKRMHSIFMLRLFNDGPCMLIFFISAWLFANGRWKTGCVVYSLSVSVKMNTLLFAPGLLLLLLQSSQSVLESALNLGICASVQLLLGAPFLASYPISYIRKAFELDRVFTYKWTVNWKFLSVEVFSSKMLSILLLALHIGTLATFAFKWVQAAKLQTKQCIFLPNRNFNPHYVVYTLCVSNFIGIAFSRTLHYQFYSWYFYSVPLLLWSTKIPMSTRVVIVGMLEYAFNVFPSTPYSSGILQLAHFFILVALWYAEVPDIFISNELKTL
jgi:alpha-1,3-mannosyltransferase